MNISLRNVKIHPEMSQETNSFAADVYRDGKRVGMVRNAGTGGSHIYWWIDPVVGDEIAHWAEAQKTEFAFEKLDQIVDRLLEQNEGLRWLKTKTKKTTLFRLVGDRKGAWRVVKTTFSDKVAETLRATYQDNLECIANENPERAATFC